MGLGLLGQHLGPKGRSPTIPVWRSHLVNLQLGCCCWGIVSIIPNPCQEIWFQTGLLSSPFGSMHGHPIMHPVTRQVNCCDDAPFDVQQDPCPANWGVVSEAICNLADTALHNWTWDPGKVAPLDLGDVLPLTFCCSLIPFAQTRELIVDVPIDPSGFVDIHIDDMIALCINTPESNSATRLPAAVLVAIHATS